MNMRIAIATTPKLRTERWSRFIYYYFLLKLLYYSPKCFSKLGSTSMLSESVSVTRNKTTRKQDKLKSGLFTSGSSPTSLQTHYSHDKDVISESKCADNTNFRFISYDQTHRSCSWITTSNNNNNMSQVEQEEQFHRWCDAKSTFNNTEIISNCQMSCGLCTTKPISSFCTSHDFKFKSPNPLPYRITYNDGTITPNIFVRRKFYSSNRFDKCIITYEETEDQFTIFPRTPHVDELFYAEIDDETGNFLDTGLVVGRDDPKIVPIRKGTKFGQILQKNVIERMVEIKEQEEKIKYPYQQSSEMIKHGRETWTNNNQYASGKIQNLVILMKFNDHPADNNLPRKEDYEKIFNGDCGHEDPLCPTGSFNDVFHQNSFYDEQSQTGLSVISVVLDWVTIGFSEEECGKDSTGGRDFGIEICIKDALQRVEERDEWLNFSEFENSLGTTFISFIHSGYDQSFAIDMKKRIWSHKGVFSSPWKSRGKPAQGIPSVTVDNYHISSGLYGSAGGNIARVGVLAHEFSHFLGLPDLYDFVGSVGAGVGNYDLMANSWGWSGTQLNPPLMSAWSKKELGWINPQVIDVEEMPRTFTLRQSCDASDAIMVTANFPAGEYIIIENRQPCGFDKELPQGGLAIWHIDDKKLNEAAGMYDQGEPSQVEWPQNGNHYRVALLQADGRYDLENDVNWGDSDDLFRGGRGGVSSIGPDGLSNGNSYPNTNAYQDGIIMNTGLAIYDISPVGEYMTLTISFGNLITPTKTPTSNKHSDSNDDNFQADNGDSLQDEHLSKEKKINCDLPKDALVKEVMFNFIAYGELTIEDINHKLCDISGSRKILAFELSYLRKKHQACQGYCFYESHGKVFLSGGLEISIDEEIESFLSKVPLINDVKVITDKPLRPSATFTSRYFWIIIITSVLFAMVISIGTLSCFYCWRNSKRNRSRSRSKKKESDSCSKVRSASEAASRLHYHGAEFEMNNYSKTTSFPVLMQPHGDIKRQETSSCSSVSTRDEEEQRETWVSFRDRFPQLEGDNNDNHHGHQINCG